MQFKRYKPTKEDKKRLPGANNVETLLLCIDGRLTTPAEVLLVGRASYEIDDPNLSKRLHEKLGETQTFDKIRGIPILTEDVDGYATDQTEEITAIAHRGSFVAELCDTYFHPLGEETLFLPRGWESRTQPIKISGLENLKATRLNPLDFILCKASAGREKDRIFLTAFMEEKGISRKEIQDHWAQTCINPDHKKLKEMPTLPALIQKCIGFSPNKKDSQEIDKNTHSIEP